MLRIKMTKRRDGSIVSRFERPDGTATWQRKEGSGALFFAMHDLEHFAVETVLGMRRGFYGLVAEGWDLSDFGTPWPRGPLPIESLPGELIVGFLDGERSDGAQWSAADFNERAALHCTQHGIANPPTLDDDTLARIRTAVRQLHEQWRELPAGETLELTFAPDPRPS